MTRTRDGLISHMCRPRVGFLLVMLFLVLVSGFPTAARAQLDNQYPRAEYFVGLGALYDGDYRSARQAFQSALRSSRRLGTMRWVDSICSLAMLGECHFQAGEPALALDFYNEAIQVHLNQPTWLLSCNFPPALTQSTVRVPAPTWGAKGRPTIPGNFPEKAMIGQGRLDNDRVFQEGGVAMAPQFLTLNANEVARCLAQAIRRRSEILGPNAVHDPLTSRLVSQLSLRAAPPNHWSQKWTECWLGLAYVAANRPTEAVASLQSSLAAGGQFDHPLTAIALVELGKLAFQHRHFDEAAQAFYEATFPASFFQQMDVLEEAFRWGSVNHLARGASGAYSPLGPAQIWARQQRVAQLQVSVMVESAEHLLQGGEPAAAMTLLDQARRMTGRRAMGAGVIGTRLQFLTAVAHYQAGNIDAGTTALAPAITRQQQSSLWLFQMGLADRLVVSGGVTERVADEMYSYFLREPEPLDWAVNPHDALAVWSMPNDALYERWFEIAVRRNEEEKALEISERWRRRQFLLSQPLGGRLLALRWLLEAPTTTLSEQSNLQRKVLLGKYPQYGELHRQVALMRDELKRDTLVPDDPEDLKVLTKKLADIARASAAKDKFLWRIAVGRDLTDWAFPRAMDVRSIRQAMPEGQVILSFFTARGVLFVFQLSRDDYRVWRVPTVGKVRGLVANTLRQMGNVDGKYALAAKDVENEEWKESARELYQMLMNQKSGDPVSLPTEDCQELVIIPQGPLWYFPFEAVPIERDDSEDGKTEPLLARTRVRYLPMLSFAMPDFRGVPTLAETIAVPGRLAAKEEDGTSAAALEQLADLLPHVKPYTPQKIPSRYLVPFAERLLVYSAIDVSGRRGALGWNPLPGDRANMDGSLAAWMTLPWGAPTQLILPGFTTPAESSLKRGGSGDELFLASCGLLASGSRTILLSRWRVGGKSTYGLINEFTQELPHLDAPNAWQRAVQLTRVAELDPAREPRVNQSTFSQSTTLDHPFFWAGYLLIDQSQLAPGEAPPERVLPDMLADGIPPVDGAMPLDGAELGDGEPAPEAVPDGVEEADVAELMEAAEDEAPLPPGLEGPLEAGLFDPLAE